MKKNRTTDGVIIVEALNEAQLTVRKMIRYLALRCFCLAGFSSLLEAREDTAGEAVLGVKELVSFWRFQEEPGTARVAEGRFKAVLLEGGEKPVARAAEGLFGQYSLALQQGQWLRIPRAKLGPLNSRAGSAGDLDRLGEARGGFILAICGRGVEREPLGAPIYAFPQRTSRD